MPHKKNPVVTENLCGLARLLRSWVGAAYENMPLWHERDISHSSVERVILPDSTSIVYYMLEKCCWVVENWRVDVDKMKRDVIDDRGLMVSGLLLTALKLAGIHDEDIYRRVQKHALAARESEPDLYERVRKDDEIVNALGSKLYEIFNTESVLTRVHVPFDRISEK